MTKTEEMAEYLKNYRIQKEQTLNSSYQDKHIDASEDVELINRSIKDLSNLNVNDLPRVISQQFSALVDLESKIKNAEDSAIKAQESAEKAKNMSAGFGKKKAAIEALQDTAKATSQGLKDSTEANIVLFDYQKQLSQITQYLFLLGVGNIAMTRTVVDRLRHELEGVPDDKISDLAKNEILLVIEQLKAQENMAMRQAEHASALEEHDELIEKLSNKLGKSDEAIKKNASKNDEQDKLLSEGIQKDLEQDRVLEEIFSSEKEQDNLISKNSDKNKEQDALLELQDKINNQQSVLLEKQRNEIHELRDTIEYLKAEIEEKSNKRSLLVPSIISVIALILSVLHFFI